MARDTELAWAAGIFDGEGYIGVYAMQHKWVGLRLHIEQAGSPEVVERFRIAVGFGRVLPPYPPKKPQHQPRWRYMVNGPQAIAVIERIRPWLSGPKIRQSDAAIAAWDNRYGKHTAKRLDLTLLEHTA